MNQLGNMLRNNTKNSSKNMLLLLIVAFLFSSCAAALVGGAFYHSSKSKEAKREFMQDYNKTNVEREKAGLEPLDLCTEKYYFDEGWAKDDPNCKKRVEAYESGDKSALGNQHISSKDKEKEEDNN